MLPKDHPFCTAHPRTRKIKPAVLAEELREVSFIFSDEGSTIRKLEDKLFGDLMFRPNVVCRAQPGRLHPEDGGQRRGRGHCSRGGYPGLFHGAGLPVRSAPLPGGHSGVPPGMWSGRRR